MWSTVINNRPQFIYPDFDATQIEEKGFMLKQKVCHQCAVASTVQISFCVQLSPSLLDILNLKHTNQQRLVCHVNPLLPQMAWMLLAYSL